MLTEVQKRLLIAKIENGEALPAEYRRMLFGADDTEYVERTGVYTLEYKGKARVDFHAKLTQGFQPKLTHPRFA